MRRRHRVAHAITWLELGRAQQGTACCTEHCDRNARARLTRDFDIDGTMRRRCETHLTLLGAA